MSRSRLTGHAARRLAALLPGPIRERLAALAGLRPREDPSVELLRRDVERRLREAAVRNETAWHGVRTRDDWERFRDPRIAALGKSLGQLARPGTIDGARITGTARVAGVVCENLVAADPRGLSLTANLYRPAGPHPPAPGLVVVHGHHCDKRHPELQEMGLSWARAGCVVIVPDLTGHGERRMHPFDSTDDYPLPFKPHRQDYYFRFNLGMQLALAGDSLMGWMVRDVRGAVDLLMGRNEVDRDRVIAIGSVAGGGDVAAVATALDVRIAGLVAFGFGRGKLPPGPGSAGDRPIPETGSGSWESTRNLRLSARDGFLPWVVLAATAPRPLVYAHEFAWEAAADPTWDRLQHVYRLYGAGARLAAIQGRGSVSGPPPENSHCTNVGAIHRQALEPILDHWFAVGQPLDRGVSPIDPADLCCADRRDVSRIEPLVTVARRAFVARRLRAASDVESLRRLAAERLGIGSFGNLEIRSTRRERSREFVRFAVHGDVELELTLLWPGSDRGAPCPVVVGFAQQGRAALAGRHRVLLRALRSAGVAVCLTGLRATGPGNGDMIRGRHGAMAAVAASELMLGRTVVGARLEELSAVLRYLRGRPEVDGARVVPWGDSLAPTNAPQADLCIPFDAGAFPGRSEPAGALIALLAALFDPELPAVVARGGLSRFESVLHDAPCLVPSDAIVPGMLTAFDVDDLAVAVAPRPLLLDGVVDALNRPVRPDAMERAFPLSRAAYRQAGAGAGQRLESGRRTDPEVARFLLDACR